MIERHLWLFKSYPVRKSLKKFKIIIIWRKRSIWCSLEFECLKRDTEIKLNYSRSSIDAERTMLDFSWALLLSIKFVIVHFYQCELWIHIKKQILIISYLLWVHIKAKKTENWLNVVRIYIGINCQMNQSFINP